MIATMKVDITKCPVPRLAPTKPMRCKEEVPWLNAANIAEAKVREKQAEKPKPAPKTPGRPSYLWTPEKDAVLIEMYRENKTNAEIADQFGMTPKQVRSRVDRLRRPGGPLYGEPSRGRYISWSEENIEQLIEMFNEDTPTKIISEKLGRTRSAIDSMITELRQQGKIEGRRRCGKKLSQ